MLPFACSLSVNYQCVRVLPRRSQNNHAGFQVTQRPPERVTVIVGPAKIFIDIAFGHSKLNGQT